MIVLYGFHVVGSGHLKATNVYRVGEGFDDER